MRDAPGLEFGFNQDACELLTPDGEQMLKMQKLGIGKDDSCLDANLVEKLDGLRQLNSLLHIHHCTVRLAHTPQQATAHTKIKLRSFGELQVFVAFKGANAYVERRDPEVATAACLQDGWVSLEHSSQQRQ